MLWPGRHCRRQEVLGGQRRAGELWAHLFCDCGRYNCFRFFKNYYTWSSYFRLDSTFELMQHFGSGVLQRFSS